MVSINRTKIPYNASFVNYNFRVKYVHFYTGMEDKTTLQQERTLQKSTVFFKYHEIIYT